MAKNRIGLQAEDDLVAEIELLTRELDKARTLLSGWLSGGSTWVTKLLEKVLSSQGNKDANQTEV